MAPSDMGAWVPRAITALHVAGPSADTFLDGPQEKRQWAVPGPVGNDHAQRASGEVQRGHCCPHERAHLPGSRTLPGPAERRRHRPVSSSESPSFVSRSSMAATSAANRCRRRPRWLSACRPSVWAASGSDPRPPADPPAERRRHAGHADARRRPRARSRPRGRTSGHPRELASRAATTGSRRWGSLLDPSAPTWAHVWPSAGLAKRRNALVGERGRPPGRREMGHLERVDRRCLGRSGR